MASRKELHNRLCEILGYKNVYFNPPESMKIEYPCIVYNLDNKENVKADNRNYLKRNYYNVTLIHPDPVNKIQDMIMDLDYCSFVSFYSVDDLNHYRYQIYY